MRLNPAMWWKAVTIMPRVTDDQWQGLDGVSRWLISTRFAAVVMTHFSVIIAGLLAVATGPVNVWIWLLALVALTLAHASNNLINDFVDFRRGIDSSNYFRDQYGPQPLERGFRSQRRQLAWIIVNVAVAVALGAVVVWYRGGISLPLMAAGIFFMVFYTWPLKYIGLGELALLVVWGPLLVGGTYYILDRPWSWTVVLASLPYALGVTATLIGKHIDKYELDKEAGVRTLPVIIGERAARGVTIACLVIAYLVVGWLVATGFFTPAMLLVLLALPRFFKSVVPMFRKPRPQERPPDYPEDAWPLWFVGSTFTYTRLFGGIYVGALVIDAVLKRVL